MESLQTDPIIDVRNLTASLMRYVQSEKFTPSTRVPAAEFVRLFSPRPEPKPPAEAPEKK